MSCPSENPIGDGTFSDCPVSDGTIPVSPIAVLKISGKDLKKDMKRYRLFRENPSPYFIIMKSKDKKDTSVIHYISVILLHFCFLIL